MVDNYQSIGSNPNREIFLKAEMNSNSNNNSSEQERLLPIANVGRIMKQILPSNAKVSKEAKETMQECVSEFISFVTVEAADKCHKEKRKTVNGDDVCWAMGSLGFDDFVDPLRRYLVRYREQEGENNNQLPNGYEEDSTNGTDGKTSSPSSIPFQFMSFMDSSYKRV